MLPAKQKRLGAATDAVYDNRILQILSGIGLRLYVPHHIHTPCDFTECGKTLAVGISPAPEVK